MQTPEMVELTLIGGSRKTYPTAEFLKQNPNNISIGFRLTTTFRLDYQHQSESTREIPDKLKEAMWRELKKEGFAKKILNVSVEFKEAQSSSLDLAILVDVGEKAGRHYDRLTRMIPRIAVEASNEYGWVIPFPQITLHTGGPHGSETPESPPETKGKKRWGLWRKGAGQE
jgi:small-conductance mechanosensitive channel